MTYLYSFLFVGFVSMIGQIILDNTKLTPGHITSIFVVIGALLDTFCIYDKILNIVGPGAMVPITSFGHSLVHGAMMKTTELGFMGIFCGIFDLVAAGISSVIFFTFIFSIIFNPKD